MTANSSTPTQDPATTSDVQDSATSDAQDLATSLALDPAAPRPAVATKSPEGVPGVLGGRARIDALDDQIADLIRRRGEVSREIQAARIADGGRRVDLRRETEIIGRYTAALGRPGTAIAMALLELGRGRA